MGGTVNTSDDASWTSLNLSSFLSEGVYRCQVTNANGRSVGQDIQLYASLEGKGGEEGEREREREMSHYLYMYMCIILNTEEIERDGKGSERMTSSWLMFCNTIINLISCLYCDCHMITKLYYHYTSSFLLPPLFLSPFLH